MVNYYEILGLRQEAGISEIKSAFRQLAKLYHPDVNPDGKEHFTRILKAYEVLSDPNLKYSYDYRLNAFNQSRARQQEPAAQARSKNWRFDERELKRRQYYNEHIKKYEKKAAQDTTEKVPASSYNEFKYILFATPLAVLLFLGIMTLASREPKSTGKIRRITEKPHPPSVLKMGDAPFTWHFGQGVFDTISNSSLTVKNLSSKDLIVCLFSGDRFVRSFFIQQAYYVEVAQLPLDALNMRYTSGLHYDENFRNRGTQIKGGFTTRQNFYESNFAIRLNSVNELTLQDGSNEGFREINAGQFFRRQ